MRPLTLAVNKHLLPVGHEPMLYHAVRQVRGAGIEDILVITGGEHVGDIARALGDGRAFDACISYRVQTEPGGIAQAVGLAERFAAGQPVCGFLGDNVFEHAIAPYAQGFRQQGAGARVVLKEVAEPRHYGVAALDGDRVVAIQEKPDDPPSSYAVVGVYFYDATLFDIIGGVGPSARGELEITAVNNAYIERGQLRYDICEGAWTDAGKPETYREANRILNATGNAIRGLDG
jgi:glucose-1-phosphate thymidylyltransferase